MKQSQDTELPGHENQFSSDDDALPLGLLASV
jgi:hypothetical protein